MATHPLLISALLSTVYHLTMDQIFAASQQHSGIFGQASSSSSKSPSPGAAIPSTPPHQIGLRPASSFGWSPTSTEPAYTRTSDPTPPPTGVVRSTQPRRPGHWINNYHDRNELKTQEELFVDTWWPRICAELLRVYVPAGDLDRRNFDMWDQLQPGDIAFRLYGQLVRGTPFPILPRL